MSGVSSLFFFQCCTNDSRSYLIKFSYLLASFLLHQGTSFDVVFYKNQQPIYPLVPCLSGFKNISCQIFDQGRFVVGILSFTCQQTNFYSFQQLHKWRCLVLEHRPFGSASFFVYWSSRVTPLSFHALRFGQLAKCMFMSFLIEAYELSELDILDTIMFFPSWTELEEHSLLYSIFRYWTELIRIYIPYP